MLSYARQSIYSMPLGVTRDDIRMGVQPAVFYSPHLKFNISAHTEVTDICKAR